VAYTSDHTTAYTFVETTTFQLTLDAQNNTWHRNIEKILKKYSNYFQDFFCIFFSKRPQEYLKDFHNICPNKEILKIALRYFARFSERKMQKIS